MSSTESFYPKPSQDPQIQQLYSPITPHQTPTPKKSIKPPIVLIPHCKPRGYSKNALIKEYEDLFNKQTTLFDKFDGLKKFWEYSRKWFTLDRFDAHSYEFVKYTMDEYLKTSHEDKINAMIEEYLQIRERLGVIENKIRSHYHCK